MKGGPYPSRDAALSAHGGVLPMDSKLVRGSRVRRKRPEAWWLLARSPVVTGRDLRNARAQQGDHARAVGDRFHAYPGRRRSASNALPARTSAIVSRSCSTTVVLSAPRFKARFPIRAGSSGMGTQEAADDLALNLRSGSLPAGAKLIEERTVGPSLGADSIRRGVTAGLVGLVLIWRRFSCTTAARA